MNTTNRRRYVHVLTLAPESNGLSKMPRIHSKGSFIKHKQKVFNVLTNRGSFDKHHAGECMTSISNKWKICGMSNTSCSRCLQVLITTIISLRDLIAGCASFHRIIQSCGGSRPNHLWERWVLELPASSLADCRILSAGVVTKGSVVRFWEFQSLAVASGRLVFNPFESITM